MKLKDFIHGGCWFRKIPCSGIIPIKFIKIFLKLEPKFSLRRLWLHIVVYNGNIKNKVG
jgi:hypothetical protein